MIQPAGLIYLSCPMLSVPFSQQSVTNVIVANGQAD
jgi:hypothetical protein